ncbi:MAG TPA: alpha/beta hydrolase [Ilumatobacter sp.]|nr:alpha/beta hydrolase [Ilumatobacter sp.]
MTAQTVPTVPGFRRLDGITCATVDGQSLGVWGFAGADGEQRPGVVLLHGGGWKVGHPTAIMPLAASIAAHGIVALAVEYRLLGVAAWPAQLDDARRAVAWARGEAASLGIDASRLAVAGGSAGGQLAALVALAAGDPDPTRHRVAAAVLYNPVVDLRTIRGRGPLVGTEAADDPNAIAAASPIDHVNAQAPPICTRVGDRDETTPAEGCAAFHRALDAAGVPNELEVVQGAGHGLPVNDPEGCADATARFLERHLR